MTKKQKKNLRDILIALILFILLLVIEHVLSINNWILFILSLIPYFIVGHHVVYKALLSIKNRQALDESFLMTIATFGAYGTMQFSEAVAVMLFYQIGEWFQDYAVNKSRASISEMMDMAPEYAYRLNEDTLEEIDVDDVEIDDILVVKAGEKIPVDGVIIEGESYLNTSMLTGESLPAFVKVNDQVLSGCINGEATLKIKATSIYEDSTVSKILELVEEAAEKKSKTEKFITRFARYYTPIVVVLALFLAFIPPIFDGEILKWLYRACTFLVISCPCALVISVPLTFFGGIGASSKKGILVKGSSYLELFDQVEVLVTDKTGTLTKGEFSVDEVIGDKDILTIAAHLESQSTHPIALSIVKEVKSINQQAISQIENIPGKGIQGYYLDNYYYLGNKILLNEHGIEVPEINKVGTILYLASKNQYLGAIIVKDKIKQNANNVVRKLKENGIKQIIMLTGDQESTALEVKQVLSIDKIYAQLLPQDKVAKMETILKQGKKVAYLGDGINDAPVLMLSDVGIAMGAMGSSAAIEAADIVLMDDHLEKLPLLKRIAHKTVSISKQNIIFALFIKILILILGAIGIANMWAAVFSDVGVAFICILNAMRILKA